ncbi:MAG: hypothetical protein WA624_20320 [Methylocella sp.]
MDREIGIGGAISLVFWFVRYRVPNMPKHVADGGILAGLILVLANIMEPDMKPGIYASTVFLLSLLGVGYAVHLWRNQKPLDHLIQSAQAQTVIQNNGGTGADISVQGSPGATTPNVGLDTNGLTVIQNGG